LAGLFLFFVLFLWFSPRIFYSLPGQIRGRVPESIVLALTTPLPSALPVPEGAKDPDSVIIEIPEFEPTIANIVQEPIRPSVTSNAVDESVIETPTITKEKQSPFKTQVPTPTVIEIPAPLKAEIDGIKIYPQKFNNCGPANLSMVLDFYSINHPQLEIGAVVKPNYDDRNVSPQELVDYVRRETTLGASWYGNGNSLILKRLLAVGYPVIVEKGLYLDASQGWMGHYLTLFGYDDGKQVFQSLDSFLGPWDGKGREVDYQSFAEYWDQFNRTFIVVYPPEQEEIVLSLVGASDSNPESMWHEASIDANLLAKNEPENAYAWFNLGTNLTELGELTGDGDYFSSAADAFDRAFALGLPWRMLWYQFKPYVTYLAMGRFDDVLTLTDATLSNFGGQNVEETYLYRGHALMALNDLDAAKRAYEKSLRLKPEFPEAKQALQDLSEID
jgi:hypothetical protein